MKFIIGVIVGIVIGSVGFTGVARLLDRGVSAVQEQAQDLAK